MMRTAILILGCLLTMGGLQARDLHYGAITDPGLHKCDGLYWQGRQAEARSCYEHLLNTALSPAIMAEAAWALGDVKAANALFRSATRILPDDPMIRTRWGELYTETYQYQDALDLFNEALERDPEYGFAHVGAASVLAKSFDSEASEFLLTVMDDEAAVPGVRLRAMLLLAHMAMEENSRTKAGEILDEAERLAQANKFNLMEVYAHRAGLALLKMEDDAVWIEKALAINPHYAEAYTIPAYFLWITHLYREAGDYYEKAIKLEPDNWQAHMELGTNHLRFNRVTQAREHLEIAYQGDPFNPKTVNTLRLLDSFDRFDLIHYPEPDQSQQRPEMILRLHKDEREILAPYTRQMVEQAIKEYSQRYAFDLKEPVIVEIYPDHEDFIVRTIGMPGMGLLGVAFGYLLAMDSPSGKGGDDYHWGTTLWHELAHVFTLEATNNRIPRWYSEGISVYEEWRNGPIPGVRIPFDVLKAMAEDKFLPIADLDRGFIRPTFPNQVIVSYMQAGLICDFIHETFGQNKLVELLDAYRPGIDTQDAIKNVFNISINRFDQQFYDYISTHYGPLLSRLEEWEGLMQEAGGHYADEDYSEAIIAAKKAIAIHPDYVELDSPYLIVASALEKMGDKEGQMQSLEDYWHRSGYEPEALKALAHHLYKGSRKDDAINIMQALNYVSPFDADIHHALGDWLMDADDPQQALKEYQVALALQPHDLASAHYRLARAHHALQDARQTRTHLLSALEIAPHYREAQRLLLETAKK